MEREFPKAPIVGVGAVVLDGNRVLLVRRGREPLKGEWSLPGGALELGETLHSGIRREIREETGIEVKVLAVIEVLDKIVRAQPAAADEDSRSPDENIVRVRYHYVLIDFLCEVTGGRLMPDSDADDARWVAHEELNSHSIYRLDPITAAVIEKAFRMARSFNPAS